jgi:hypothetical protein
MGKTKQGEAGREHNCSGVSEVFSIFIYPIALSNYLSLKISHKWRDHTRGRGQAGLGATKKT